jgi:hypothetical protein
MLSSDYELIQIIEGVSDLEIMTKYYAYMDWGEYRDCRSNALGTSIRKWMSTAKQRVRVIAIPPNLPQDDLHTPELFAKCLGHSFEVVGRNGDLLELAVGEAMGVAPYLHSIWIEEQYTEVFYT